MAAAIVVFAVALTLTLQKRCHGKPDAETSTTGTAPKTAGDRSNGRELTPPSAASAPAPRTPGDIESKPADTSRSAQVSDIFGEKVNLAHFRITNSSGYGLGLYTGEDGRLDIPEVVWEDSIIHCGDFHLPVKVLERGVPFQIPGKSAGVYGELAILPLGWEDLRVSLQGRQSWSRAAVFDERLGHRFLYLLPGKYDIANEQGLVMGTAEVRAGHRTSFTVTKWSGLKVRLSFVEEPESLPGKLLVRFKGLSSGASHPEGTALSLWVADNEPTCSQYGLIPGVYQVFVDESAYEFSEIVDLVEGKVSLVEVRLRKK